MKRKKKIVVLGITGSIGESVLEIVNFHNDSFEIVFATANSNYRKLLDIAKNFNIPTICITNENRTLLHNDRNIVFYQGKEIVLDLIKNEDYDIIINAISGSDGLIYTIAALESKRTLALANKESLVMAGHLCKELLNHYPKGHGYILPIDSEHSAIFQVIHNCHRNEIKKLHITASGGALRDVPITDFDKVDLLKVLKHPTWQMGTKVTIDSATMLNKGLEVIEAHWLFDIYYDRISAIIHPQSIIHSIVEFIDGSMHAQMSIPTMQLPILYALSYPNHLMSDKIHTNLVELPNLSFEEIDKKRYPLYYLALEVGRIGGLMPTIMNAANELAINKFIKKEITFLEIYKEIDEALQKYPNIIYPELEEILEINERIKADL
jgi:1-deoxy-D-xylulose-5-phosphate reductoisomerase